MSAALRAVTFDSWSAPDDADDAELRRLVERLSQLGPRPTYELLREILAGADLASRLKRYAALDPAIVKYLGGDGGDDHHGGKP